MEEEGAHRAGFLGRIARRLVAFLALTSFLCALPAAALAHTAEPLTLAEWKRTIFVTPDREIDRSDPAVAATAPVPPPVAVQTSSEKLPPRQPMVQDRVPELWLRREPLSPRKPSRPGLLH